MTFKPSARLTLLYKTKPHKYCKVCKEETPHSKSCEICRLKLTKHGPALLASFNVDGSRKTIPCEFLGCARSVPVSLNQKQKFCMKTHEIACEICSDFFEAASKKPKRTCSTRCQQILYEKISIERYGVKNAGWLSSEAIAKTKETNMKRYGVEFASQSEEIKEKTCQTNLKRYGVPYHSQAPDFRAKIKEIFDERHGGFLMGSPITREKIRKINLERYGVENPFQAKDHLNKTRETYLKKYGTRYPSFRTSYSSQGESEVKDFIKSIYSGEVRKDRKLLKGKELDIYLPELKLAIEFNGTYWHHDHKIFLKKNKDLPSEKHRWKQEQCNAIGVDLIFVWEHDWMNNATLVQHRLLTVLTKKILELR